jgi:hypothetical protein
MSETIGNKPKTPTITIIGSGGHGVASLYELLKHTEYEHSVYFNTGDWGGSWGLWGRLLEFNDNELNTKLHGSRIDVLPFADINKAICHFITVLFPDKFVFSSATSQDSISKVYKYKPIAINRPILDFRSNLLSENKLVLLEILKLTKFNVEEEKEFRRYFEIAWSYFQKNKVKLKVEKPFCLGYVLQFFVFFKSTQLAQISGLDPMSHWNQFWQKIEVLPRNVYLDFTSKNRQVMTAKNLSLEKLMGEDQVDSYYSPILPETMIFENINQTLGKPKKPFLKVLEKSDLIIIPNGSVGNWLSVINYQKVKTILQGKNVVWLTNPYRNKNELINPNYVLYFKENGIDVKTLVPSKNNQNPDYFSVLEQDKNGRYVPDQVAKEILKFL